MASNGRYKSEIEQFERAFSKFKSKRIVLYGIGRLTATILESCTDFRFVGLMDRLQENVGKHFFDLPVLSKSDAEKNADLIIINTMETYWGIIYQRIKDVNIPVYFRNGEIAEEKEKKSSENPYASISMEDLVGNLTGADVVSFDFFDTLFMRRVCSPRDVFGIVESRIAAKCRWKSTCRFTEARAIAVSRLEGEYTFDELYEEVGKITGLDKHEIDTIKELELEVESSLLVPRKDLLDIFIQAVGKGYDTYIVSDMYFPISFYTDTLRKNGIEYPEERILVSGSLKKSKHNGSLWDYYSKKITKERKTVHIGDDRNSDSEQPGKFGIIPYLIPSAWNLLEVSSLGSIRDMASGRYEEMLLGLVISRLFNSPFSLPDKGGKVLVTSRKDMGYVLFGPVLLCFLQWLTEETGKDGIRRIIFLSRDGFFLNRAFKEYCCLTGLDRDCSYLYTSRQLAMAASVENDSDLMEYLEMPYTGTVEELFQDRLGISDLSTGENTIERAVSGHRKEIYSILSRLRDNYMQYLKKQRLDCSCGIVDLWFYGNSQKYLRKMTGIPFNGYYFNADLSSGNPNAQTQMMKACFQKSDDLKAERSGILRYSVCIESLLTAPYGMIKGVDAEGAIACAKGGMNQELFQDKEEIFSGASDFMKDFVMSFGQAGLKPDPLFVDSYFGACMDGGIHFETDVTRSFYNDNAMMNRLESPLFA